jgi:carbon monoxide dehydrogenase subunit G
MKINVGTTVAASADDVFGALLSPELVVGMVPGAEFAGYADDGPFRCTVRLRIGPVRVSYAGQGQIEDQDPVARTAVLIGTAKEAAGSGTANARAQMSVTENGPKSSYLAISTDVALTGKIAQMGSGIISEVARRLLDQMATNLSAELSRDVTIHVVPDLVSVAVSTEVTTAPLADRAQQELRILPVLMAATRDLLRSWLGRRKTRARRSTREGARHG